jgi:histidine triad (HIT) family protein
VVTNFKVPHRVPCPFCEIQAGRYAWHGPPAVIFDDELIYVFLNPAPMGGMPGHSLVVTKRHVETIFDASEEEALALGTAVVKTARALRTVLDPDGILVQQSNGVAAFQTVPHLHFHVIPKAQDSPFPPIEDPDIVPSPERVDLAVSLRMSWGSERA